MINTLMQTFTGYDLIFLLVICFSPHYSEINFPLEILDFENETQFYVFMYETSFDDNYRYFLTGTMF
jgi:hypothetical protein